VQSRAFAVKVLQPRKSANDILGTGQIPDQNKIA